MKVASVKFDTNPASGSRADITRTVGRTIRPIWWNYWRFSRVNTNANAVHMQCLTIQSVLLFGIVNGIDCENPTEQINMLCCRMQSQYMLQDMVYVFNTGL